MLQRCPVMVALFACLIGLSASASAQSPGDRAYNEAIQAHVTQFVFHPGVSFLTNGGGRVLVAFRIDGKGRLLSSAVQRSSCAEGLERAALAVLRNAQPYPAPPDGQARAFALPLVFQPVTRSSQLKLACGPGGRRDGAE